MENLQISTVQKVNYVPQEFAFPTGKVVKSNPGSLDCIM